MLTSEPRYSMLRKICKQFHRERVTVYSKKIGVCLCLCVCVCERERERGGGGGRGVLEGGRGGEGEGEGAGEREWERERERVVQTHLCGHNDARGTGINSQIPCH